MFAVCTLRPCTQAFNVKETTVKAPTDAIQGDERKNFPVRSPYNQLKPRKIKRNIPSLHPAPKYKVPLIVNRIDLGGGGYCKAGGASPPRHTVSVCPGGLGGGYMSVYTYIQI
jgi:hypothetical protein